VKRRKQFQEVTIALIGGDGRRPNPFIDNATIRSFASQKYGAGNSRSAAAAIRNGRIDGVVLIVRLLGHSESHVIVALCRAVGVPLAISDGGVTCALRVARDLATAVSLGR
jgi:hypothetical protein